MKQGCTDQQLGHVNWHVGNRYVISAQFLTVLKTSSININSCVVYADVCTCWLSLHIVSYNIQQTFLMAAQKRKRNRSSNYLISVDQHDLNRGSDSTVAKLRYVPQTKRSSWWGSYKGVAIIIRGSGGNDIWKGRKRKVGETLEGGGGRKGQRVGIMTINKLPYYWEGREGGAKLWGNGRKGREH